MERQYEPRTSLDEYGEGILDPIKIKSQGTTFGHGFKSTRRDFHAMIAQRREKRHARAAGQTVEAPLKIPVYLRLS